MSGRGYAIMGAVTMLFCMTLTLVFSGSLLATMTTGAAFTYGATIGIHRGMHYAPPAKGADK